MKFEIIRQGAVYPVKATEGSSGYDVFACEEVYIPPMDVAVVPTGLIVYMEPWYELQIRSRSGLALKNKIFVLNSPATIDSDYSCSKDAPLQEKLKYEIKVILFNLDRDNTFVVTPGDRIAQLVPQRIVPVPMLSIDGTDLSQPLSKKRRGGFGHTGIS